jgi:hypothetical protein
MGDYLNKMTETRRFLALLEPGWTYRRIERAAQPDIAHPLPWEEYEAPSRLCRILY